MNLIRRSLAVAVTSTCVSALATAAVAAPALAAPSACTPLSHQTAFGLTRSVASWKVPAPVHSISIRVSGAAGASSSVFPTNGGPGGSVTARVPVTPGQVLSLVVGASGGNTKNGDKPVYGGGGYDGGGGSFVFSGGKALVVAGGGGAGGYSFVKDLPDGFKYYSQPGGTGGKGGNGTNGTGTGATTTAPGSNPNDVDGSATGTGPATSPTKLGVGGTTPGENSGGGGYYGGGGGNSGGGDIGGIVGSGGGGSGYLAKGVVQTATTTNRSDGRITIYWSACPVS